MRSQTAPDLPDNLGPHGDAFYSTLMEIHEGLSTEESHALNARLVLILANEIGHPERLAELMQIARSYADAQRHPL